MSSEVVQQHGTSQDRVIVRSLGRPGDLGWVVMAHGEIYSAELGWDTLEAIVVRIVADYITDHDPSREAAWIAEVDGRRAGSVFCVAQDGQTARLRVLLVDPGARGLGLGARLVDACIDFATAAGYRRITLSTNDVLDSARRIYRAAGFELVDEQPHHDYGHDLVGETWTRELQEAG